MMKTEKINIARFAKGVCAYYGIDVGESDDNKLAENEAFVALAGLMADGLSKINLEGQGLDIRRIEPICKNCIHFINQTEEYDVFHGAPREGECDKITIVESEKENPVAYIERAVRENERQYHTVTYKPEPERITHLNVKLSFGCNLFQPK